MKWPSLSILRASKRTDLDEQVRRQRGQLAQAIVTNDRKIKELRQVMAGALKLREELDT